MHFSYLVFFVIPYLILIVYFIWGWNRTPSSAELLTNQDVYVSILIPVRNEAFTIKNLISGLCKQNYPKDKMEVIFIDDHSTDETIAKILNSGIICGNNQLLEMPNHLSGKKMALWRGIEASKGVFILMTDGDVSIETTWVEAMVKQHQKHPESLIIGPVFLKSTKGFWQNFQCLEFLSLIASGAGAAGTGHPILCNGANLGVDRKLLNDISNVYHSSVLSGDDIFLLLALKKKGVSAFFAKDNEAVVETKNTIDFRDFVSQRSRWTFKSRYYKDIEIIAVAVIVLFTNLYLIGLLYMAIINLVYVSDFIQVFVSKSIVDFILLFKVAKYFKRQNWLKYFLFHQIIYIFYISMIGIIGHFSTFSWKSRSQ
jgi:poly-beta-1,6-N-acetyl-D-glucosamine synthase